MSFFCGRFFLTWRQKYWNTNQPVQSLKLHKIAMGKFQSRKKSKKPYGKKCFTIIELERGVSTRVWKCPPPLVIFAVLVLTGVGGCECWWWAPLIWGGGSSWCSGGGGKVRVKARALVNITSLLPPSLSPALTDQTITGISNGKLAGNYLSWKLPTLLISISESCQSQQFTTGKFSKIDILWGMCAQYNIIAASQRR